MELVDLDIPFLSLMIFTLKFTLAAIPALVLIFGVTTAIWKLFLNP